MILTQLHLVHAATRWDARQIHTHVNRAWDGQRPLWCRPAPDLLVIQSRQALTAAPRWADRMGQGLLNPIPAGAPVTVSLIGCPTMSQRVDRDHRGIRVPLPADRWAEWFTRKTAAALTLDGPPQCEPLPAAHGSKSTGRVTCQRVAFRATARVQDDRQFHHLREAGIGTGKAYGCGLMLAVERSES